MLQEKPAASREITVKFSLKKLFVPAAIGLLVFAAGLAIFFKSSGPHYDPKGSSSPYLKTRLATSPRSPWEGSSRIGSLKECPEPGAAEIVEAPPGEAAPGTPKENERLRAAAKEAGAGHFVSGAYFLQGKTLSLHARVSDMSNGKLIKALDPISASVEEPMKAIEVLEAEKVMGALAEITEPRFKPITDLSGQPPTYEAYKEYAAGRDAFLRKDFSRAIELYLRAAELDSSFKTPLLAAAVVYWNLGQYAASEKLINGLEKVRETLGPRDQLSFDSLKALYQGDLAGQLRVLRQIASRVKGGTFYGWGFSTTINNRPREAVKALSMLDPEGIWMKDWHYYWSVLTFAYHMLGRHRTELKQARRARRQFPESWIILICELRALSALGRIEEIERLVDQSLNVNLKSALFPDPTYNHARVLNEVNPELRVHRLQAGIAQDSRPCGPVDA